MSPRPWLSVFAREDRSVQLTWRALPASEVTIEVGDRRLRVEADPPAWLHRVARRPRRLSPLPGGPGALDVADLEPGTTYEILASGPGLPLTRCGEVTTLEPPPGKLLSRFATVGDVHVGEPRFGAFGTIQDAVRMNGLGEPHPLRAARAAVEEALAWGAELIVAKGDLTHDSEPEEFEAFARLLNSFPVPNLVVLGNHDVRHHTDGAAVLARNGVHAFVEASSTDLPGVRLITGHTPRPHDKRGHLEADQAELVAKLAGSAPGGVVLVLHHPPQLSSVPLHYPPGLVQKDSLRLLRGVAEANPATIVIAGHTHRNRLHLGGPLPVAEVGSPKDYPGGWAGYAVHEGGIRQVVRRVTRPDVMAWTESTAFAIFGQWGRWSPGTLADRCWSYTWPGVRRQRGTMHHGQRA